MELLGGIALFCIMITAIGSFINWRVGKKDKKPKGRYFKRRPQRNKDYDNHNRPIF